MRLTASRHVANRIAPIAVAATAFAIGCKAGPDYKRPKDGPKAPEYHAAPGPDAAIAGVTTVAAIRPDWWSTLNEPKLTSLVRQLVDENLDLKTADFRVREARASRGIAASAMYPQVTAGTTGGAYGTYGGVTGAGVHTMNEPLGGFFASWEIDAAGGVRRSIEAAQAGLESAAEARRDTLVTLLAELGRNYIELRSAQRLHSITVDNIELQEKTLALVQRRKDNGLATDLEVAQASNQLETSRASLPRIEAEIAKHLFRLAVLVGKQPEDVDSQLAAPAPLPELPPEVPVGLPSDLLQRRPDIRFAERQLAVATARLGVAKADLYPKFYLTAFVTNQFWYAGPAAVWPIYNGGRTVNNIRAADARLEEQTLVYKATLLSALEDVENSLTAYAKAFGRRGRLYAARADAERAVAIARTQYTEGMVDFLNVLDAQARLLDTSAQLVQSEGEVLVDLCLLFKALGGGWEPFELELELRTKGWGKPEKEKRP